MSSIDPSPQPESNEQRVAQLEAELVALRAAVEQHRAAEALSAHIARLQGAVRDVTRRLARTTDVAAALADVCAALTGPVGFGTAWVALVGERARAAFGDLGLRGARSPSVVAIESAGFEPAATEQLASLLATGEFTPCSRQALERDATVVFADPITQCATCALHKHTERESALSRRIGIDGEPLGVVVVSLPPHIALHPQAVECFGELTDALGAALERAASLARADREARRYREIFEGSRDGLLMLSPSGQLIDCNAAFCDLVGRSADELRAQGSLTALSPAESSAVERETLQELLTGAAPSAPAYENAYVLPDGTRVPVEVQPYATRSTNGQLDYLWGVVRDLRPRLAAEARAARTEANFREFVESMHDVMLVVGPDNRVAYGNAAARAAIDPQGATIAPRDVTNLFASHVSIDAFLRDVRLDGQRRSMRAELQSVDGHVPVEINAWPGSWSGVESLFIVCEDLTAEEQARARFERMFRRNPCPMALQSAQTGAFIDVNDAWIELTGYTRERALNTHYQTLDLAVDPEQQRAIAVDLVGKGRVNDRPLQIRRYDGQARDGRFWGEVLIGPAGPEILTVMVDVTEQLAAEREARETQLRYEQLLESSGSYAWEVDTTGLYTFVSPTTQTLLGRAPESIAGHLTVLDLMPQADRDRVGPLLPYVFTSGEPIVGLQNRVVRPDGTVLWMNTNGFPVRNADGEVVAYRGIDTDITAAKLADDRIRQSELLLREAQAIADLGCWALNLGDQALVWTDETFRLFGYEPGAFAPDYDTFLQVVHPDDRAMVDEAYSTSVRDGRPGYEVEHRVIRADTGEVRSVYERCIHERDDSGTIVRSVGIVQDITVRNAAEDAVRLLASQAEQAPFGVVRTDRDRRITWVNAAFTRLTGYALHEVLGRSPGDLLQGPGTAPAARLRLRHALDRLEPVNIELLNYRRDGTSYWLDLTVTPLRDRRGEHIGFVGYERDASERIETLAALREATDGLEQLNQELERRVAERTLEVHRQAAALESSLEAVAMYAGDTCVYRNPRHVTLFGADIDPGGWTNLYCERLAARVAGSVDETGEHRAPGAPLDARAKRADGTSFDAEVEFTSLPDGTTVIVTRDVSDRRAAERELAAREARYRALMEGAGDAIMTASADGTLTEVNRAAETMLGYTAEELHGRHLLSLHPPEAAGEIAAIFERMATGEISTAEAVPMIRKDGTIVFTDVNGRIVQLDSGEIVIGIFRDITARREAERRLRELSDQLALSLRAGQIGCWSHDLHTGHIEWDDRMYALYGKSRETFVPTFESWAALLSPADRDATAVARREAIDRRGTWDSVFDIVTDAGERRTIRRMGLIVTDERGEPCRSIGIHYDVTHMADRERALEALNHQLAEATRQKDEFLANMSHELRTPLNAILGMSEALEMGVYGTLEPRQRASLQRIEDSGRHLLSLINDVLDLAKIEAGKIVLTPEHIHTEELVGSMISTMSETARAKGVGLRAVHDPDARRLRCDARRVRQILLNLLSNALKFTEPGGTVTLRTIADPIRQRITFEVTDTGEGIPAERIGQLFQPFVQLESTLTKRHGGTGLGLSIVRRLAELHDGGVGVVSEPGRGSTFSVWFPVEAADLGPVHSSEPSRAVSEPGSLPVIPDCIGNVLVIEDNDTNIQVVRDFLESRGYRVTVARDGADGVRRAESGAYDLMLMDVQMPVMDGLEATRRIRALPGHRKTPIIALTSYAMPGDRDRCLAAGMTEYMAKPISLRALEQMIRGQIPGPRSTESR